MKRQKTKSSNEIMLLVDAIKKNRKLNNLQAVSFLAGLLYSYANEENIDEIFKIVSKEKVGVQIMSSQELEQLIFQIDLMLTEDVGELFTTPEEK